MANTNWEEPEAEAFEETPFLPSAPVQQEATETSSQSLTAATWDRWAQQESAFHFEETGEAYAETEGYATYGETEAEGESVFAPAEADIAAETLQAGQRWGTQEAWEAQTLGAEAGISEATELDPYLGIRSALSPEHAHRSAEEIAVTFGGRPALVALHSLFASGEPQQAVLAALLGRAGRRSLRVHHSDLSIPAYLRLLSRLCREAAETSELTLGEQSEAGAQPTAEMEVRVAPRPQPAPTASRQPVTPVPDAPLSRAQVMRWFPKGSDSQEQPLGRITSNNRVVHLIRGRSTFDAMMRAMRTAGAPGHYIYLLAWFLDDSFPVSGSVTMQQLFTNASKAGVAVRAMLWDQWGRQNSPEVDHINALRNGAAILDNRTLVAGSHHQKILVINGSEGLYAFCGGVDINPDRINTVTTGTFSSGGGGSPLHDVHCQIQGPAAFDLQQIFQQRWNDHPDHVELDRRKGAPPMVTSPAPVPNALEWVQVGRTFGNGNAHRGIDSENFHTRPRGYTFLRGRAGEQTVKQMILHAIGQARRFIYLEDQYLVSLEIRDALIRALPNIAHLTILIPDGSISDLPQGNFRRREFIAPLRAAGGSKVRVFHPFPPTAPFGYVHAKMWVFDDEYAIIGSANCNRRGYTHDSEAVAGICGEGSGNDLRFAHRLRIDLWALHLNMNPAGLSDGVASAAFWLRSVGSGRIEPHNENAGIERIHTDTSWNNVVDPDGS